MSLLLYHPIHSVLDRIVHVDTLPEGLKKGESTPVYDKSVAEQCWQKAYGRDTNTHWTLGGSGTNVIKSLPRLFSSLRIDASCYLLGIAGKDKSKEVNDRLRSIGIIPALIEGNSDNAFANSFVTPDNERTMQAFQGSCVELTKEHILPCHFENVSHVHLEGYLAYSDEVLETGVELAQKNGSTISLDLASIYLINAMRQKMKTIAEKVDMLFGNLQEMEALTGSRDVSEMVKTFNAKQIVVITNGADGCWVKPHGSFEALKFRAQDVAADKIIDTTGAGDYFLAGFLAAHLSKKELDTCVKIANLTSSSPSSWLTQAVPQRAQPLSLVANR